MLWSWTTVVRTFIVAFPWQNSTVLYVLLSVTWLKDTDGTHYCVFKEQFQYFWLVTVTHSWRVHRERIVAFFAERAIMLPMLLYEAFDVMMPDVWLFSLPVTAWQHHLYLKNLWTLCWQSAVLCPAFRKLPVIQYECWKTLLCCSVLWLRVAV